MSIPDSRPPGQGPTELGGIPSLKTSPLPCVLFTDIARRLDGDEFKVVAYVLYELQTNYWANYCFDAPLAQLAITLGLSERNTRQAIERLDISLFLTATVYSDHPDYPDGPHVYITFGGYCEYNLQNWKRAHVRGTQYDSPIYRRDGLQCQYCHSLSATQYHIDHVIPRLLGGPSRAYNLVVACQSCNTRKGADIWIPANLDVITERHPDWRAKILEFAVPHE